MGDGWLIELLGNRWLLAIAAYALGFATAWFLVKSGWLAALKDFLWPAEEGGKSSQAAEAKADEAAEAPAEEAPAEEAPAEEAAAEEAPAEDAAAEEEKAE